MPTFDYHYGLVVGITHYPAMKSNLRGPVRDARAFHKWLVDPLGGGVPKKNTRKITTLPKAHLVTGSAKARPIKHEVDTELHQLNEQARTEIDDHTDRWNTSRLYVYLAGHGIMPGNGKAALLLADAGPGLYWNIEVKTYLEWYQMCGLFREVVVFADCCRSWYGDVNASEVPFMGCPRPRATVLSLVGYAAGPGELALENIDPTAPPDEVPGYFTKALLDGLRGAAAVDPDSGGITSTDLSSYVAATVAEATKGKRGPQQVGMVQDEAGHPIVFQKVPTEPHFPVTIRFPAGWTDPVDLLRVDQRRERYDPALGPWRLQLPAGAYAVFRAGTFEGRPFKDAGRFQVIGGDLDLQL